MIFRIQYQFYRCVFVCVWMYVGGCGWVCIYVVTVGAEYEYPMCSCLINDKIYWTWFLHTCSIPFFLVDKWSPPTMREKVEEKRSIWVSIRERCDYIWTRVYVWGGKKMKKRSIVVKFIFMVHIPCDSSIKYGWWWWFLSFFFERKNE